MTKTPSVIVRGIRFRVPAHPAGYFLGSEPSLGTSPGPVRLIPRNAVTSVAQSQGIAQQTVNVNLTIADGQVLANETGGSAVATGYSLTSLIDYVFGSAQGDILYRDSAAWKVLAPGTSGWFLKTQGAGANPVWAANSGVTITGSPVAGNLTEFSSATSITNGNLSGDVTTSGTLATTIKSSVALAGNPTTTTQSVSDNSTKIATTAFVQSLVSGLMPGGGIDLYGPPIAANFSTIINGGTGSPAPSISDVAGLGTVFQSGSLFSGNVVRAAMKNIVGSTWTISSRLRISFSQRALRGGGIVVTDGTAFLSFWYQTSASGYSLIISSWTNSTTFNTNRFAQLAALHNEYLRIQYDGTNLICFISTEGRNWVELARGTLAAWGMGTPTQYGFFADPNKNDTADVNDLVYVSCPYWAETSP